MDNETSAEIIETGDIETNDSVVETDVSDEVIDNQNEQAEKEEVTNETNETTEPEKIKVKDKEYTPDELSEILENVETQKAEQESTQYQPRELTAIETDIKREIANFEAEAISIHNNFITKATPPIQEFINPETGLLEQRYAYSAEEAFQHGIQKGEWDYFINCLSPADAVAFQDERSKFAYNYNQKLGTLEQEQKYIEHIEAKKADLVKWDEYIKTSENPAESYLLNELKNDYEFDDKAINKFLNIYRKSKALEQNKQQLIEENDNAKADMMNSTIIGTQKPQGTQRIFTREEIKNMSLAMYEKYEKQIDEQVAKGLIK